MFNFSFLFVFIEFNKFFILFFNNYYDGISSDLWEDIFSFSLSWFGFVVFFGNKGFCSCN